jgi:sugar lactone lactonase YvrE
MTAHKMFPAVSVAAMCALLCHAGETRTWTQSDAADFEKGVLRHLSLRSDGLLTLAPRSRELLDASAAYLWALARDSKGNLYAGGGTGAKLYRIAPGGGGKLVAELEGLEIHALAVDARDRVYAATSPDGKIYRVAGGAKPEMFYDPKAKYIWAMAFDAAGNLFVATGDRGEVHRVTPGGKGAVFYRAEETHARSLAVAGESLIVGTEPGGLVIRVSAAGEGFVLYQMPRKEVTAVAVAPDGAVYAAALGIKDAPAPPAPAPAPAPTPATVSVTVGSPGGSQPGTSRMSVVPQPLAAPGAPPITGGSVVYRIDPAGNPVRVWSHAQDLVYSIAAPPGGGNFLGTGNKGGIYRLDSETRYTSLLTLAGGQVTALAVAPGGRLHAATGNTGKVYEIGPELEAEGVIESDVLDAGGYSLWGRLSFEGRAGGGSISIATRSGNLDQPQKGWIPWTGGITATAGARMASPPARFLQWKATLAAGGGAPPELESVSAAYLPRNAAPRVEQIEMTAPNFRFPATVTVPPPARTLSLPPLGKKKGGESSTTVSIESGGSMQYAKGFVGARWSATDPNGDTLVYRLEIRGAKETVWKPLVDKLRDKQYAWDSTRYPDGEYRIRVTASDAPSNPPAEALSGEMESDVFLIDNTPPGITNLAGAREGNRLRIRWHAADALNNIKQAEYSLDSGDWTVVSPVTRLSDSMELDYDLTLENAAPGEHTVAVRVEDDYDNQAAAKVVVR